MAIDWPTPGLKGRTFKLCVLTRWDFNFCVRSSPLRGIELGMLGNSFEVSFWTAKRSPHSRSNTTWPLHDIWNHRPPHPTTFFFFFLFCSSSRFQSRSVYIQTKIKSFHDVWFFLVSFQDFKVESYLFYRDQSETLPGHMKSLSYFKLDICFLWSQ